jgi:general secretion pathway protein A
MFLEYYGLRDQPFGVTPDPRYLYFSATHREALGSLFYGLETGCGFLALIAPPGMGKTTLLTHMLERLRGTAQTVFLFHTQCDSRDFLSLLLSDLGVDAGDQSLARMYELLHSVLLRNARTGRKVVLVIDEAQNLANSVLETVRLLSDFETPQNKLIQIVLSGQPQLADKLGDPSLMQLRQRVSIVSKLRPLSALETLTYIDYRLMVAGHSGRLLFNYDAVTQIAAHSGGIPRNINNLCFNALTLGYAKRQKQIDTPIVTEVVADFDLGLLTSNAPTPGRADADSLLPFGGVVPTDELTYGEFRSALRSAWAKEQPRREREKTRSEGDTETVKCQAREVFEETLERSGFSPVGREPRWDSSDTTTLKEGPPSGPVFATETPTLATAVAASSSVSERPADGELNGLRARSDTPGLLNSIGRVSSRSTPVPLEEEQRGGVCAELHGGGGRNSEEEPSESALPKIMAAAKNGFAVREPQSNADQPGLYAMLAQSPGILALLSRIRTVPPPYPDGPSTSTMKAGD